MERRPRQPHREPPRFRKGPPDWRQVWRFARAPMIAFVIFALLVYLLQRLGFA
jgi:hypothetical protein